MASRVLFSFRRQALAPTTPGSPGFLAEYESLKAKVAENPVAAVASLGFLPGSLGHAIEKFTGEKSYFTDRAEGTLVRKRYGVGVLKDLTTRSAMDNLEAQRARKLWRNRFATRGKFSWYSALKSANNPLIIQSLGQPQHLRYGTHTG